MTPKTCADCGKTLTLVWVEKRDGTIQCTTCNTKSGGDPTAGPFKVET